MKIRTILLRLSVGVWLVVSLASLVAMYQLWWSRERVLYWGKSAEGQRVAVVERAGIPAQTLDMAKQADAVWPLDAVYDADGSEVSLSYFKYLVLPRIPSDSEDYRIEEKDASYILVSAGGAESVVAAPQRFQTVDSTPRGLILSALVLFAIAAGLFRFGICIPEGMVWASLLLCATSVWLKPMFHSFAPIGVVMCALGVVGAGTIWKRKSEWMKFPVEVVEAKEKWGRVFQILTMAVLGGAVLWGLIMAVVVVPDDWDAWAQWGPKAKILAVSSGPLGDVKFFVPGSGDYPLLWPSVWAFSGWCAGGWEEQWSKGWGVLFLALTVWQIKIFVDRVSGRRGRGWRFAALFVSMPVVPLIASWGYAEAPFWLMLVCAMSRLLQWRDSGLRKDLWLAGVCIAGAACTKNEGILFAVLSLAWVALCGRKLRDMVAVVLPVVLVAGAWKAYCVLGMDASNHAIASLSSPQPGLSQWIGRLAEAGQYVWRQWTDVKQWNLVLPGSLLATVWLALRGRGRDRMNLLLPLGMLVALFMVVLMYGDNWRWQLGVAWNRLTLQFYVLLLPVLAVGFTRKSTEGEGPGHP